MILHYAMRHDTVNGPIQQSLCLRLYLHLIRYGSPKAHISAASITDRETGTVITGPFARQCLCHRITPLLPGHSDLEGRELGNLGTRLDSHTACLVVLCPAKSQQAIEKRKVWPLVSSSHTCRYHSSRVPNIPAEQAHGGSSKF